MIEIRQILCPIDFSDFSRHALVHAVALARWYQSTITLLHVHYLAPIAPAAPDLPPTILDPELRDDVLQAMKRMAAAHVAPDVPVRYELDEGGAVAGILATAASLPGDLIVMGTHGRAGFERLILGSVTEKVLRKAPCPVLSVPHPSAEPASPLFRRILCAIDFSDCSMRGLDYAISLAQEADATLTVLHVLELPPELPTDWRQTLSPPSLREHMVALEENRRAQLEQAVPAEVRTYCTVETEMEAGAPYRAILRMARDRHSDLIVIGVRGRGAADVTFFGSTANQVVRHASCGVLTIRS